MKKLSRFVHVFQRPNTPHFALYHAGTIQTVFLDNQELPTIDRWKKCIPEEELSQAQGLVDLQMVVEEGDDEKALAQVQKYFRPYLSVIYLILTDVCNLGCKYCFIESSFAKDYKTTTMTWKTAKKAIDIFRSQADRQGELNVWFYGGEPLVNHEVLFRCVDYLSQHEDSLFMTVITNGTLITPEIAREFARRPRLSVSVSVDGPKEVHDTNRVFKSGGGSFDAVKKGTQNLKAVGKDFGISLTVGTSQADRVAENIAWVSQEFGTNNIGINFLVDTPRGFVAEEYVHRANQSLIESFKQNREGNLIESRFMRKITAFVERTPHWNDCAACGNQFVVAPDGRIGVCHEGLGERRTFVSHVDDKNFNFHENPVVKEWARRSPLSQPECHDCPALTTCGGGCPYGAMLKYGSIWDIDKRFCVHSKETLEWLVWDLYDKTMGNN